MGPHVPAQLCILDTGEARSGDMRNAMCTQSGFKVKAM